MRSGVPLTCDIAAQPESTQTFFRSRKCQPSSPATSEASLSWSLSPPSPKLRFTSEDMSPSPWRASRNSFSPRATP